MLKIVFGDIENSIYHPPTYFNYRYEDEWITNPFSVEIIKDIDKSDVIVTRENLPNLPYSVNEIYGIHTSGKYHDLKRTYNEMYQIYSTEALAEDISRKGTTR